MAILYYSNGKAAEIKPKNETFSLEQISYLINGIAEFFLIDSSWLFVNKLGAKLEMPFNVKCSNLFGFSIYGDCLIVPANEIPAQFFIPTDIVSMIKDYTQMKTTKKDEDEDEETIFDNTEIEKEKKEDERKLASYYNNIAYDLLFNKEYDEIINDFAIFSLGKFKLRINKNNIERIAFLEYLLDFFKEEEEYNKCLEIKKLQKHIIANDLKTLIA